MNRWKGCLNKGYKGLMILDNRGGRYENYMINLKSSSKSVAVKMGNWELCWVDVDVDGSCSIDSTEVLGSQLLVESYLQSKHSNGFSSVNDLNWETESGVGDIWRLDWDGWFVSIDYFSWKNVVALVVAVGGWFHQFFWKVVYSDIDHHSSPKMRLSAGWESYGIRVTSRARIFWFVWSSLTVVAFFDFTSAAASVSIVVVAIIARKNESFAVTTNFIAKRRVWFSEESGLARITGVAIWATGASWSTGETS